MERTRSDPFGNYAFAAAPPGYTAFSAGQNWAVSPALNRGQGAIPLEQTVKLPAHANIAIRGTPILFTASKCKPGTLILLTMTPVTYPPQIGTGMNIIAFSSVAGADGIGIVSVLPQSPSDNRRYYYTMWAPPDKPGDPFMNDPSVALASVLTPAAAAPAVVCP